jgi:hypothetical protein
MEGKSAEVESIGGIDACAYFHEAECSTDLYADDWVLMNGLCQSHFHHGTPECFLQLALGDGIDNASDEEISVSFGGGFKHLLTVSVCEMEGNSRILNMK